MIKIDWKKDYKGEFICPKYDCLKQGMRLLAIRKSKVKRQFQCGNCKKISEESYDIKIEAIKDPFNESVVWYTGHRIQGFICPKHDCGSSSIYFTRIRDGKKHFKCQVCEAEFLDSITLTRAVVSRKSDSKTSFDLFNIESNRWNLKSVLPNINEREDYILYFEDINLQWFRNEVKKYIYHLCKLEKNVRTMKRIISTMKFFSQYLSNKQVSSFDEINRSLIQDFMITQKGKNKKLESLKGFFSIGTIKGWFNIDQDIIRHYDYPKQSLSNPDPMSSIVRKQIEDNLYILPDPIFRMWSICYFCAMRPSELAFLKQDCLEQIGMHWNLVWYREKGKDSHKVPISRAIAKLVQEQQEYIKSLWGSEWDYLFCHYCKLSSKDASQSRAEPIKQVIPKQSHSPLTFSIRTLISTLNISDENGQLAKFQNKILRPTRMTELFAQGHDLALISAWAGHKQLATTSTYYTQVSCELMDKEAGHIQKALTNNNGLPLLYESYPKSFWENPTAHKLELGETHINTPIYGYCGLPLEEQCKKFRACYTCTMFVATIDKLPQYIIIRDKLREKEGKALASGADVMHDQFRSQADQIDKIIASLQRQEAA